MYKIFGYHWHTVHNYRLCNALHDCEFYFLNDNSVQPNWNKKHRPVPKNVKFVDRYEPDKYDFAILHADQMIEYHITYGALYRRMNSQIKDIPKIVIYHGFRINDKNKERAMQLLKGNWIVFNAEQIRKDFGNPEKSLTIHHGYDVDEFKQTDYSLKNVLTVCSQHPDTYFWAGADMVKEVAKQVNITWMGLHKTCNTYDEYRELLSQSSIYLSPHRVSPMPGARTEAMLSGLCVVTTNNLCDEDYLKDGFNCFVANTPKEMVTIIRHLQLHEELIKKVGMQGRITAIELFDIKQYRNEWLKLIQNIL